MGKKTGEFDITMGSFDGAETCELVTIFILYQLKTKFGNKIDLEMYRDDGLAMVRGTSREIENTKKKICKIFKNISQTAN